MSTIVAGEGRGLRVRASLYLVGEVLNRALNFILIPVYTRFLTPTEYGAYGTLTALITILIVMLSLGFPNLVAVIYHRAEATAERQARIWTMFSAIAGFSLIVTALLALGGRHGLGWVMPGIAVYPTLLLALAAACFGAWLQIPMLTFQAAERPVPFVLVSLCSCALNAGLILLFLVGLRAGINGMFAGLALAAFLLAGLAWGLMRNWGRPQFRWRLLLAMMPMALPLVPTAACHWAMALSDRLILQHAVPLDQIGYYTLAYQVANVLTIAGVALNSAWAPMVFRLVKTVPGRDQLVRLANLLLALEALLLLGTILGGRILVQYLLDTRYAAAIQWLPYLVWSAGLSLFYFIPVNYVYATGKTGWILGIAVLSAAVNVVGNLALIPLWGVRAAALTTLLSWGVMAGAALYAAGRLDTLRIVEWRRAAWLAALTLLFFAAGWQWPGVNFWCDSGLLALLLALFAACLLFGGVVPAADRRALILSVGWMHKGGG